MSKSQRALHEAAELSSEQTFNQKSCMRTECGQSSVSLTTKGIIAEMEVAVALFVMLMARLCSNLNGKREASKLELEEEGRANEDGVVRLGVIDSI